MMNLLYWIFAEYPLTMILAWSVLPLAGVFAALMLSLRGHLIQSVLLLVVSTTAFIMGMMGARETSNPYILAQEVQPYEISKLADLRREYPAIEPMMRKAAADGRISNAEFIELTEGKAIEAIMHKTWVEQQRRDRQAVIDGIPPVENDQLDEKSS
jgi:hypothetical protein